MNGILSSWRAAPPEPAVPVTIAPGDRRHLNTENRSISKPAKKRLPRPRVSKRARALLRGPKRGELAAAAEAAEILERSLLAATGALGVHCRRGEWWLPG
jgi:hypothetical protein